MRIVVRSPLTFFAKLVLMQPHGVIGALTSMVRGGLAGMLVPFLASDLIKYYGTSQFFVTGLWLIICFAVVSSLEVLERYLMNTADQHCRKKLADWLAAQLAAAPAADLSGIDAGPMVHRFFASLRSAAYLYVSELPGVAVGLIGFVAVLVSRQVPWPVFVAVAVFLAIPIGSHWLLKRSHTFKSALQKEDEEMNALGLIYADRRDPQIQPALWRHRKAVSQEAFVLRRQANRSTMIHVGSRAALRAVIGVTAVTAALSARFEIVTLLLVFALTFSGYLSGLYYFAEFFHKIHVDAAGVLEILKQQRKPPLPSPDDIGWAHIDAQGVRVEYVKPDSSKTVVTIGNLSVRGTELCILNAANGSGKTTLANILSGKLDVYEGSLTCWGHEISEFDPRCRIAMLEQTRRPKPVTVGELFKGIDGTIQDEPAMLRALYAADIACVDFGQRHDRLSQGMLQKVDLALFLYRILTDMEVFVGIFDEPTNHVSLASSKKIATSLRDFCVDQFESTALVISHDPGIFHWHGRSVIQW